MSKPPTVETASPNPTDRKRTNTRKIGNCTFIVSSSFKDGKQKDIVSTIARLIQSDSAKKPSA